MRGIQQTNNNNNNNNSTSNQITTESSTRRRKVAGSPQKNNTVSSSINVPVPSPLLYQGRPQRQKELTALQQRQKLKGKWIRIVKIVIVSLLGQVFVVTVCVLQYRYLFETSSTTTKEKNANPLDNNNNNNKNDLYNNNKDHAAVRGRTMIEQRQHQQQRQQEVLDDNPDFLIHQPYDCRQIAPCYNDWESLSSNSCQLLFPTRFWSSFSTSIRLVDDNNNKKHQQQQELCHTIYNDFVRHRNYINENIPSYQQLDSCGFLYFEKNDDEEEEDIDSSSNSKINHQSSCNVSSLPNRLIYFYTFGSSYDESSIIDAFLTNSSKTSVISAIPFYQHHTKQSYLPMYLHKNNVLLVPNKIDRYEVATNDVKRESIQSFDVGQQKQQQQQRLNHVKKNDVVMFAFVRTDVVSRFLESISRIASSSSSFSESSNTNGTTNVSPVQHLVQIRGCFTSTTFNMPIEQIDCVLDVLSSGKTIKSTTTTTKSTRIVEIMSWEILLYPQTYLYDAWTLYGKHDLGIVLIDSSSDQSKSVISALKNQSLVRNNISNNIKRVPSLQHQVQRRQLVENIEEEDTKEIGISNHNKNTFVDDDGTIRQGQRKVLLGGGGMDHIRGAAVTIGNKEEEDDDENESSSKRLVSPLRRSGSTGTTSGGMVMIRKSDLQPHHIWMICRMYIMDLILFDVIGMTYDPDCPKLVELFAVPTPP